MRRSQFFLPVLRDAPASAQITSHQLMLRSGMIQQSSAGIYSWLPMGLRVLKKVENIIREEQDRAGAQEIMMPILQPADIWRESGRYAAYGDEMFRLDDRGGRNMLLAPTHEEVVTDIARAHIQSHRDLPRMLYQIHWKFRDERRPRFGVMRGREFLMKDTYSFDLDYDAARASYRRMFFAYLRTFARMGLDVIPARADPGPIGGDLSHEFILLAENGESDVFFDETWLKQKMEMPAQGQDCADTFDALTGRYAATDEMHEKLDAPDGMVQKRGIEIGHIFYFGTRYSKAMDACVADHQGREVPLEMGSYGIGVSRLPGAIAEASHDENGLIWPASVAPFDVALVDLNADQQSDDFYARLKNAGFDVLYDDREVSAGQKFAEADLIGVPWQVVVSPRGLKKGQVELKHRQSGERFYLSPEDALERIDLDRGLV